LHYQYLRHTLSIIQISLNSGAILDVVVELKQVQLFPVFFSFIRNGIFSSECCTDADYTCLPMYNFLRDMEQKEGAIFKGNVVGPFFFFLERTYQSTESV
jgi:hypothetical protein